MNKYHVTVIQPLIYEIEAASEREAIDEVLNLHQYGYGNPDTKGITASVEKVKE